MSEATPILLQNGFKYGKPIPNPFDGETVLDHDLYMQLKTLTKRIIQRVDKHLEDSKTLTSELQTYLDKQHA